jgi:hypothetical protein
MAVRRPLGKIAMFKLPLSVVALALLASCATSPVPNEAAAHVPSDRILAPGLITTTAGTLAVTIKRDSGFLGGACSARAYVDGKPVADLRPGERVVVHLAPGDHIFSAQPNGVCAGRMSEVRATVKPGTPVNFTMGYGNNGDWALNVTAF